MGRAGRALRRHRPRVKPAVVLRHPSPNRYSGGNSCLVIVLHSTEGPNESGKRDLALLGVFFSLWQTQASSHVAVDDDGLSARFVRDRDVAWHVAEDNPRCLGIEEVGFAAQRRWSRKEQKEAARWIAQWSHDHGIPITHSTTHGVCRHKDLGAAGGGHEDPGDGYPLRLVLRRARRYHLLRYGRRAPR